MNILLCHYIESSSSFQDFLLNLNFDSLIPLFNKLENPVPVGFRNESALFALIVRRFLNIQCGLLPSVIP